MAEVTNLLDVPDRDQRVIRWHLGVCESSLETALTRIARIGELSPEWLGEYADDVNHLRVKLDELQTRLTYRIEAIS
jgi:hypothetical protein